MATDLLHQDPPPPAEDHAHLDPLSGERGAHPVGTGVGAAGGAAALGAIGSLAGPVGTAVGLAVGAVLGGLTGKGFAEGLDPTEEEAHWRQAHLLQPYADPARKFEDYLPAYRAGYSGYVHGQTFEEREADLRREYEGGPQNADAEKESASAAAASTASTDEPRPGTMEYNLSTRPLHDETAPDPTTAEHAPGSMEDNLSTRPLAWSSARAAAQAAYQRAARLTAERRAREAHDIVEGQ